MARYFKTAFAEGGDKIEIPMDATFDGGVSYAQGYTQYYELDPKTNPLAKRIERAKMNAFFNDLSSNAREWQQQGLPEWIADKGDGAPYAYAVNAMVRHNNKGWISTKDNNSTEPRDGGADWKEVGEKPDLSHLVTLATAQTISAIKTFTALPKSNIAPTLAEHLANKAYVDGAVGKIAAPDLSHLVTLATDQTIDGLKTFAQPPVTAVAPTDDTQLANKAYVDSNIVAKGSLVGSIIAFAGTTIPTGYLTCDGSAVSRTTYAALFAVIGTTYGVGNNTTTFNLPNLVSKVIQGAGTASGTTVGTSKNAGLPNITGNTFGTQASAWATAGGGLFTGAFLYMINRMEGAGGAGGLPYYIRFDASRSNSIYGASTTVQPPALCLRYLIKY